MCMRIGVGLDADSKPTRPHIRSRGWERPEAISMGLNVDDDRHVIAEAGAAPVFKRADA